MKVLVCGGREFNDWVRFWASMDNIYPRPTLIIHGDARGADKLAGVYAADRGIPCHAYPADWQHLGDLAGPIRNAQMLHQGRPDLVVAFPGGAGTRDMIRRAQAQRIPIIYG